MLKNSEKMKEFEEWCRSQVCKCCGVPVSLQLEAYIRRETQKITDLDGEIMRGFYCKDCAEIAQARLMNERFVEVYKGETIFCKDGKYSPYWKCPYYFKTIEECRARIDSPKLAVSPFALMYMRETV